VTGGPAPLALADLIEPLRRAPATSAVVTDFDGTISPIVRDAGAARALPQAVTLLHHLAGHYARVAVVSGRPAAFLSEHLDLAGAGSRLVAVGLYGLEQTDGSGRVRSAPGADRWRPEVESAAARAEAELPAGVVVERKGLTVTFHWRPAPGAKDAVVGLANRLAGELGLEVRPARMSLELTPPIGLDKGIVVERLCAGLSAALYAGDDVGDLPAFAALGRLREAGTYTVSVAVASDEAPPDLLAGADLVLAGVGGTVELLRSLDPSG
jgi:trehalose 6-phosphate phosphatase